MKKESRNAKCFMVFFLIGLMIFHIENSPVQTIGGPYQQQGMAKKEQQQWQKQQPWLLRSQAENWVIPDWNKPWVDKSESFSCQFTTFTSKVGNSAPICVHSFPDRVSRTIRRKKRWKDCDILSDMWNRLEFITDNSIYLDIGANIGSCVMEMLLSTNATIVAFEPHPINLFALQSTIRGLDKALQDRITLVPVGLGEIKSQLEIFSAKNNMGNSVIGKEIKDYPKQKLRQDHFQVPVERLDSILSTMEGTLDIALVKMDAQGYECHIVEGMGTRIPKVIRTIKFEVANRWLEVHGCLNLFSSLRKIGFTIIRESNGKVIQDIESSEATNKENTEFLAVIH